MHFSICWTEALIYYCNLYYLLDRSGWFCYVVVHMDFVAFPVLALLSLMPSRCKEWRRRRRGRKKAQLKPRWAIDSTRQSCSYRSTLCTRKSASGDSPASAPRRTSTTSSMFIRYALHTQLLATIPIENMKLRSSSRYAPIRNPNKY
jgi:hypothetical protein